MTRWAGASPRCNSSSWGWRSRRSSRPRWGSTAPRSIGAGARCRPRGCWGSWRPGPAPRAGTSSPAPGSRRPKPNSMPAPPRFAAAGAVQGVGVLCALPALLQHGLLAVGEHVYGRLRNGFYGLRSVLLTLAVLALLRVRTSEQLQGHAPHRGLAERWIAQAPDAIGFLYIDGHVRPYHGHAHRLPEAHVARRRLCLPATTDFYVNDQQAAPVFLVTAPANDRQLGPDRRVTVVFDREGWSPKL